MKNENYTKQLKQLFADKTPEQIAELVHEMFGISMNEKLQRRIEFQLKQTKKLAVEPERKTKKAE